MFLRIYGRRVGIRTPPESQSFMTRLRGRFSRAYTDWEDSAFAVGLTRRDRVLCEFVSRSERA
jgi:hypothetical protein